MTEHPPIATRQHAAFFKQSGWIMVATVAGGLLSYAVHFLNRSIPTAEYSRFVLLLMVTNCLPTTPLQMVFAQQTVTALATERGRQLAGMIRLSWVWLLVIWLAVAAVIFFFQGSVMERWQLKSHAALWITLLTVLVSLWMPMLTGVLQGCQNFFWIGWCVIVSGVLRLGVAVVLVKEFGLGATGMVTGALIAQTVTAVIAIWLTRDLWTLPRERFDGRGLLRQITPLCFGFGVCQFMLASDSIFANAFFTKEELGPYSVAGTLSRALLWLVLPLAAVMFPKILHSRVKSEKSNLMGIVLFGTAVLSVCCVVGLHLVGPMVVKVAAGRPENVAPTLALLPWYSAAVVPLAMVNVLVNDLMARERFRVVPVLVAITVAYGFTLPYVLNHVSRKLETVLQTMGIFNCLLLAACLWAAFRKPKSADQNPSAA